MKQKETCDLLWYLHWKKSLRLAVIVRKEQNEACDCLVKHENLCSQNIFSHYFGQLNEIMVMSVYVVGKQGRMWGASGSFRNVRKELWKCWTSVWLCRIWWWQWLEVVFTFFKLFHLVYYFSKHAKIVLSGSVLTHQKLVICPVVRCYHLTRSQEIMVLLVLKVRRIYSFCLQSWAIITIVLYRKHNVFYTIDGCISNFSSNFLFHFNYCFLLFYIFHRYDELHRQCVWKG